MSEPHIIVNRLAFSGEEAMELLRGKKLPGNCIVVAGGDGTIHRLVNRGIPSLPLAIIPSGTANDLAIAFGIPCDKRTALNNLCSAVPCPLDLIEINGRKTIVSAAIGLPYNILERASRWRNSPILRCLGKGIYFAAIVTEILTGSYKLYKFKLIHDGGVEEFLAHTILLMNQSILASHLVVAPEARNNDGYFDLVIFTTALRFQNLSALLFNSSSSVIRRRFSKLKIEAEEPVHFVADGELYPPATEFEVSILRHALKVMAPTSG
jgi:diacylglycerol kinase (ATP)